MKRDQLDSLYLFLAGVCAILAFVFGFGALWVALEWLEHFLTGSLDQFYEWAANEKLGQLRPDFCQSFTGFGISAGLAFLFGKLQKRYQRWW